MHGQWSSPVAAEVKDGTLVIFPGGDGWIYAFRPASGLLVWKFDANPKEANYKLGGKGTRNDFVLTSGVVHDGKLYIGIGQDPEHDAGPGMFWCLDLEKAARLGGDVSEQLLDKDGADGQTGKPNPNSAVAWRFGGLIVPPLEEGREYTFGRTMSCAAVVDGLCYIAEQEGILHCLDAGTGKEFWQHDLNASTWSSPYYANGKIYMGNDKGRVLIFAHGKVKKKSAEITMKGHIRAPFVAANGVLYVITENRLYAIAEDE
jgi:outer membrane protein assembly factor BamB